MCPEGVIRRFAGVFILASLVLYLTVGAGWLWLTVLVGFNLLQSSITGFCPLERVLGRLEWLGCRPAGSSRGED